MANYAILDNRTQEVLTVSTWDEESPWAPPPGTVAIKVPPEVHAGHVYDPEAHTFTDEYYHRVCHIENPEHDARDGQEVPAGKILGTFT